MLSCFVWNSNNSCSTQFMSSCETIHRLGENALTAGCFYSNTIEYRSASRIVNLSTTGLPIREATLGFPFQLTR